MVLSSAILLVVLLTSSLNLTVNIEAQKAVWFILPLFPIFVIFFIGAVAETNRAPFDLAEASLTVLAKGFKHTFFTFKCLLLPLIRYYTTTNCDKLKPLLNPYWITGFTDAEGCFTIKYSQSNQYRLGWRVQPVFQIKLHGRDIILLNQIKTFFGVGTLVKDGTYIAFTVKTVKNLCDVIIPHFNNYPLLTQKYADFVLFKQIVAILDKKQRLTNQEFEETLSLRANLNLGMSEKLKTAFPNVIAVTRPDVPLREIYHPYWLTGFIDGEGCFFINIQKNNPLSDKGITDKIWLTFQITQHYRDVMFMKSIIEYLHCGRVRDRYSTPTVDFIVNNYHDINTTIISFLERYPLQSVKQKDFKDFCLAAKLIGNKEHLTLEGIEKIQMIKKGMNKKRLSYL